MGPKSRVVHSGILCRIMVSLVALTLVAPGQFSPLDGEGAEDPAAGRGRLVWGQLGLALAVYGPASAMLASGAGSWRIPTAAYLLGAGAAFGSAFALREATKAQAHMFVTSGVYGAGAGLLLCELFDMWQVNAVGAVVLASTAGGQAGGYALAGNMTAGQAALMTTYTGIGIMDGALVGIAAANGAPYWRVSPYLLGGMAAGATAGWFRQRRWQCTEGQAAFVGNASVLGAFLPLGLYATVGPSDLSIASFNVVAVAALVTGTAATWWSERYIADTPLTVGQGTIVTATMNGGAVLCGLLGYLISASPRGIAGGATLGSVAGLFGGLALTGTLSDETSVRLEGSGFASRFRIHTGSLVGGVVTYACNREASAPTLVSFAF
jgi:hypothetical protein